MNFKFKLDQKVTLSTSGESGKVIGRAEYLIGENAYYVRYKTALGSQTEVWWEESALEAKTED